MSLVTIMGQFSNGTCVSHHARRGLQYLVQHEEEFVAYLRGRTSECGSALLIASRAGRRSHSI